MMRFGGILAISRLRKMNHCGIAFFAILLFSPAINPVCPSSRISASSQQDSRIEAAQQVFAEGQQLLAEGTAASQRKAIAKFTEAAALWRAGSDKRREAIALSFVGKVHDLLGEKQQALDSYPQTLALVRAVGDRSSEAATLNNIGLIHDSLGEKQKALTTTTARFRSCNRSATSALKRLRSLISALSTIPSARSRRHSGFIRERFRCYALCMIAEAKPSHSTTSATCMTRLASRRRRSPTLTRRSEEHTSELQSPTNL